MKKILLFALFILAMSLAIINFPSLATKGEFDSIIIDFREDIPTTTISENLQLFQEQYQKRASLNSIFSISDRIYVVDGDKQLLRQLKRSPFSKNTEYIEPNYIYRTLETPNDPDYSKQWNLRSINIEKAWEDSKGEGITVAVIDTGVTKVPDLNQTEMVPGYNFVEDKDEALDDNGHGTHVAGTIAQSTNNNYGVAGVAYKAKIMPLKVLSSSGGGTVADIAEAIRYAADNGASVINLSLGGGGESKLMQEAIDYAYYKGLVLVAAAGNSNQNSASYPARYPHVIGVTALDSAGKKAGYSNFGAGIDISAPGGSETAKILQETIDPSTGQTLFAGFMGTSMASPHVAGVAALVKAAGVTQPDDVVKIIKQSAIKVQEDPLNHFGAGQLDAAGAVQLALKGQITFRDFFRWLRDNGYINPRFWLDGGVVALLPKILMVLGSYLLAWFLRNYLPLVGSWALTGGMVFGSCGLFFLRGIYIFDLPHWPLALVSSSLPELGNVVLGRALLNPIFASVLIPFLLLVLLMGTKAGKLFAVGSCLGVASCLAVSAALSSPVWGLGAGTIARTYLLLNALLCFGLAYLASKGEKKLA